MFAWGRKRGKNEDALWGGLLTWPRRKCSSALKIMVTQGKVLLLCQWAPERCQEMDSYRSKACQHIIEIDPMGTDTAAKCKMFAKPQADLPCMSLPRWAHRVALC